MPARGRGALRLTLRRFSDTRLSGARVESARGVAARSAGRAPRAPPPACTARVGVACGDVCFPTARSAPQSRCGITAAVDGCPRARGHSRCAGARAFARTGGGWGPAGEGRPCRLRGVWWPPPVVVLGAHVQGGCGGRCHPERPSGRGPHVCAAPKGRARLAGSGQAQWRPTGVPGGSSACLWRWSAPVVRFRSQRRSRAWAALRAGAVRPGSLRRPRPHAHVAGMRWWLSVCLLSDRACQVGLSVCGGARRPRDGSGVCNEGASVPDGP